MNDNNPDFVKCAMDAIEEGIKAADIQEECACRMGYQTHEPEVKMVLND